MSWCYFACLGASAVTNLPKNVWNSCSNFFFWKSESSGLNSPNTIPMFFVFRLNRSATERYTRDTNVTSYSNHYILMLKKEGRPELMVRLNCIELRVIRGTLIGQRYVDEVLHPHAQPIYRTIENMFFLPERKCLHYT